MKRILLVLLAPLTLAGCGYNRIQTLDEQAAQSKQQIEVQLQRRADLVPNLVNTVRGYASQEEANLHPGRERARRASGRSAVRGSRPAGRC